ncbi:nuclear transport factor 2 family protein [Virgibacillus litoralis]|nr:nuclear transport factor 2 family protein [Virgibacillus litoralis]
MDNQVIEFTQMHDEFILDWNEAMISGDTTALERMTEDYYVAFFKGLNEKPSIYNREEAVSGMKHSVKQLIGAEKRFENRVIRLRDNENAVVFYEQLIVKDEKLLTRLFTIENWQLTDGGWQLVREAEEPIN